MPENLYSPAYNEFFSRLMQYEKGLSLDPDDPGNWTGGKVGKGELKGTKYGVSAAQYPTLDIVNLTVEQARTLYLADYWQTPGFWRLPGQLAIRVADVGVNCGQRAAVKMLQRAVNAVCAGEVPARRRAAWRQKVAQILGGGPLLVDGLLGPITEEVIKVCPYRIALLTAFQGEAYLHYRRLSPLYVPGWLERLGS